MKEGMPEVGDVVNINPKAIEEVRAHHEPGRKEGWIFAEEWENVRANSHLFPSTVTRIIEVESGIISLRYRPVAYDRTFFAYVRTDGSPGKCPYRIKSPFFVLADGLENGSGEQCPKCGSHRTAWVAMAVRCEDCWHAW